MSKHPDELEILRLLDGELPEAEARRVQRHLESCWQCRTERNETQSAIDAFVRYRDKVLLAGMAPPPGRWPDLQARCEAYDEAHQAPARRRLPVWRLVAAGTAGLALLGVTIAMRERPVQAPAVAPAEKRATAAVESRGMRPKAAAAARTAEPAPRSLLAVEVEVWERLHEAGADLGEPVEVEVTGEEVLVKTMALEAERIAELRRALANVEGARVVELALPAARAGSEGGVAVAPRPLLFAAELRRRLGSDAAREEFANAALDMGEAILARAHALRRLEERFAGKALGAPEEAGIGRMRRDHRDVLRRQAGELRKLLASVFPEEPAGAVPSRPAAQAAREFDEAISAAFAGAQSRYADAELLEQLQRTLRELAQ